MALNDLGEEYARPISMPVLKIARLDDAAERREIAQRFAEQRVIRAAAEAWQAINRAESFEAWCKIAAGLAVGRKYALRASGASEPWGRNYTHIFSHWCRDHGFGTMRPATRSWCLALHQNLAAITAWRDSLPSGRGRRPPVNPQSCVKGWQRSRAHSNGHSPQAWKRDAIAAWRKFLDCVSMLPPADQAQMWSMVSQASISDVAA